MQLSCKLRAHVTNTFHNKVYIFGNKTVRDREFRNRHLFEAAGFTALATVKVNMQVIDRTIALIVTDGIFHRARSVIDTMYHFMFQKQADSPRDRRFINRFQRAFQIAQRKSQGTIFHRSPDEQSNSGRFNAVTFKFLDILLIHRFG
jgi:hypothetical protein